MAHIEVQQDVRAGVLVNCEGGAGVQNEDVGETDLAQGEAGHKGGPRGRVGRGRKRKEMRGVAGQGVEERKLEVAGPVLPLDNHQHHHHR